MAGSKKPDESNNSNVKDKTNVNENNNKFVVSDVEEIEIKDNETNYIITIFENKDPKNKCFEFSKKLKIRDKNILVEDDDHQSCIIRSPDHATAFKANVHELRANLAKFQEECEAGAQTGSNQSIQQLNCSDESGGEYIQQQPHATVHMEDEDEIAYDRLWRIPRVRQYWHDKTLYREAKERTSSYTELFWDLIFVVVVQNLGRLLVGDISFGNLQKFIVTFYPIFRVWLDVHSYLNVYSSQDILEKFLFLWEMCLVMTMGIYSLSIFENISIYLITYVIARLTFFLQYFYLAICIPMFRVSLITSAWGIFIPCIFWIIAIFVRYQNKVFIMWSAIVFEICWTIFIPIYNKYGAQKLSNNRDFERVDTSSSIASPHKAMRTRGTEFQWKWTEIFSLFKFAEYRPAINIEHWSERFGIFVIICLGEAFFGIIYATLDTKPDLRLAKAILSLIIVYNLHWIYFDVDASRQFHHALRRHIITNILFGLIHLPLNMALIAFGSSTFVLMQGHFPEPEILLNSELKVELESIKHLNSISWLWCESLAVSIYCMAIIGMLHQGLDSENSLRIPKEYRIVLRIIVATIITFLPLSNFVPLKLIGTTSALSLFLVLVETYGGLRRDQPLFGKVDGDIIGSGEKIYIKEKSWTSNIFKKMKNSYTIKDNNNENTTTTTTTKDKAINNEYLNVRQSHYSDESYYIPSTN